MREKEREMQRWSKDQIAEHMTHLLSMSGIALARAVVAENDATKTLVAELEERLRMVRASYRTIDVSGFPNVIVASLASLQGQEKEIQIQLGIWRDAKATKKSIDEEVELCEKVLKDKDSRTI
jgi:ABC-type xylose transport system substrate-binding protein